MLTSEYSVASHNYTFCPLKNCSYHIILISTSINELLQKLDDLSFQYQTVDCLYTLYKHQFFRHTKEEAGLVFSQLKRGVQHNSENKFVEKLPGVSKKRLSRKKFKRHLLRAEQRNASTQTLRPSFLDRIQSLKNSKYQSELIKIVDCLLGQMVIEQLITPCCTLKLESNKVFVLKCFIISVYSKSRNLKTICLLNVEFSHNIFC